MKNRKERRDLLGPAFKLAQRQANGEKLNFKERNILNIAKKKARKIK